MMIHLSTEKVANNFGEKGFKVYLMTESFALIGKYNALDRVGELTNRFSGIELHYEKNKDENIFKQRHKPFNKVRRWGRNKLNIGL